MRLSFLQLLVDGLLVVDLLEQVLDRGLLNFEFALLIRSVRPLLMRQAVLLHAHDEVVLALGIVQVVLKLVNLVKQLNILLHEALVHFFVTFVGLGQRISQVVYVRLQVFPDFLELKSAVVIVILLVLNLLSNVKLVQLDN